MANLGFREALFGTALALSCAPLEPEDTRLTPRVPTPNEYQACERRAQLSRDEMTLVLLALGSFDKEYPEAVAERAKVECLMELEADPEK